MSSRVIKWLIVVFMLIASLAIFAVYQLYFSHYISTDDAYLNADVVQISSQVSGPIQHLYVENNQWVKRAAPLLDIDPAPFEIEVAQAQAQLALTRQNVLNQAAAVEAAKAVVVQREAELLNAQQTTERTFVLVKQKVLPQQAGDNATAALKTAVAAVSVAQANLNQAVVTLGALGENNEEIRSAEAGLAKAKLDLQHTHILSPNDGNVASLELRPGNMVIAGQTLFQIISSEHYWVDANFKETDLARIKPGQAAVIKVDMYPDHPFQGRVESISGGSGAVFSLLPPQNATGNWVKITQRVPVRVVITNPDPNYPLRIGTTATVTIRVE